MKTARPVKPAGAAQPAKPARPTKAKKAKKRVRYTQTLAQLICSHLADGMSLAAICAMRGMPKKSAMMDWLLKHDDFRQRYGLARALQADALFDEILTIADGSTEDTDQRAKLKVDTRKWMAARLAPKKYGDKIGVDLPPAPARAVIYRVVTGVPRPGPAS